MKNKIGILVEQLNRGGAERIAGLLSEMLTDLGYSVVVITLFDDIQYAYKGKLINLGQFKNGSRSVKSKFQRYGKLKDTLENEKIDLLFDFRMKDFSLREILLNKYVFKCCMINMVRHYYIPWYFPQPNWISKKIYKDYKGIISVSKKSRDHIKKIAQCVCDYGSF